MPDTPGIYLMKDSHGRILYVGKAGNLRRRVSSYFLRPHDIRIERLVREIASIDFEKTDTAIEALILESKRIKELKPFYNVKEKDDKSFLNVVITKEKFPRVLLARGTDKEAGERFGPFTSASSLRAALKMIRKIFPWNTHPMEKIGAFRRPCFDHEIGLCPGTCIGAISRADYLKQVRNIRLFLQGKKSRVIKNLEKEMKTAAKAEDFERAGELKRQLFALKHIQDVALIKEDKPENGNGGMRIEGYDISNISGTDAVGSMVVFVNGAPDRSQYRKFRIKTVVGANPARHALSEAGGDTGMLQEVLARRFKHAGEADAWPLPALILIDGGAGQVNAAKKVLADAGLKLPIIGMAKGPERKRTDIVGELPPGFDMNTLIRVRDEAHRFAISYHKNIRSKRFLA